jgi:Ca-activated chloride channel family protein
VTESLSAFLEHFHWQRPLWLLAIPLALVAVALLWRQQSRQSGWQQLIPEALLQHLLQGQLQSVSRLPLIGLGLIWLIGSLAMAGPSWEKIPQPIHKSERALVVLLDLSPSMLAQDLKPSRLVRARLKLIDFLKAREEGLTALVAFAGEAHVITPLTDDTRTITSLVPALSPNVMPLAGSNPEMAVELALQLLADSGIAQGELLLITDGLDSRAIDTINDRLSSTISLSILGVGTDEGAPIPISSGGFARDKNGGIVLARLNSGELQQLSLQHSGRYRTLAATDSDIKALAQEPQLTDNSTRETTREFDLWQDRGPWLALLLLPLLLLGFRRGWLLSVVFIALPNPQPAYAFGWDDLWQTADQQGQQLLQQGEASEAAKTFKDQDWAAASHYQAGEFESAAEAYAGQDGASGHYNRGNALAKGGKLQEAIEAYQQALEKNPDLEDARFNKDLVEKLLEQQQQNQQQNQQQGDSQSDSSDQNQQDQNQQGQNQQQDQSGQNQQQNGQQDQQQDSDSQEQQSQEQPSQNQQSEEQQNSEQADQSEQESEQQSQQQEQSQEQAEQQENSEEAQQQSMAEAEMTPEQKEQQQALEQYLRKVPDDPSGLMRKKFEYQHHQRRKQYQQGTWQPPENNATERW